MILLTTVSDHTIENLLYEDPNKKITPVWNVDKDEIRCFCNYVIYCSNKGKPIGNNWKGITTTSFYNFVTDPNFISTINTSSTVVS
jgi:hypothetical protein